MSITMQYDKFIMTNDSKTKDDLLKLGYLMINSLDNLFIFQNKANNSKDSNIHEFFELNKNRIQFTNKLFF